VIRKDEKVMNTYTVYLWDPQRAKNLTTHVRAADEESAASEAKRKFPALDVSGVVRDV
jgi:hypothetical protein